MKSLLRVPWLLCASFSSMMLLPGCASSTPLVAHSDRAAAAISPAVAIVVRVAGGHTVLSPREFAQIHREVRDHITEAGFTFARNADVADLFVVVRYTPDPVDSHLGHVAITGTQPNPMKRGRVLATAESSADSFERMKKVADLELRAADLLTAATSLNERLAVAEPPTC
jgi:hypothetical protein